MSINQKRIKVLNNSLLLEFYSSLSLAFLLDIDVDDIRNSKSLGNKSSSISFNQKVNLLLDNKSIQKDEKLKLESFMSIRNQFMHNLGVKTFADAFNNISGLENKLKKIYPDLFKDKEQEESLELCIDHLFSDGMDILINYKGGRKNKLSIMVERDVYKRKHEQLLNSITNLKDFAVDFTNKEEVNKYIDLLKYQIINNHNKSEEE